MAYYPRKKAYEVFGSGRLTAPLYKFGDEGSGWTYRFEICEMDPEDGAVPVLLRPEELPDLRRILRLVAFTIADDGCVRSELREKLRSLACDLDEAPAAGGGPGERPIRPHGPAAEALRQVLDYLWEDEARDFDATPSNGHIYRRLVVLDRWLEGYGPPEGLEVTDMDQVKGDDRFGLCPICGRDDGYLNLRRAHWFVCHTHRLRWCAGENLFSTWRYETPDEWSESWRRIRDYREVRPLCLPRPQTDQPDNRREPVRAQTPADELPRLSPDVVSALWSVLQVSYETEEQHFEAYPSSDHPYRYLLLVDRWLEGVVSPENAVLPEVDPNDVPPDGGGCPLCGRHDGHVNLACYHWFFCREHQTCWCLGHNLLDAEEYEDEISFRENWHQIRQYRVVTPFPRPSRPRDLSHPPATNAAEQPPDMAFPQSPDADEATAIPGNEDAKKVLTSEDTSSPPVALGIPPPPQAQTPHKNTV